MEPVFFATPEEFRAWLSDHHDSETELIVGLYRKGTGRPSITWPESVDEALCYGWIDGVRRKIDDESYSIRFTPRRPSSTWSEVNTRRAVELIRAGRMQPDGLRAYEARQPDRSGGYSFEQRGEVALDPELESRFRAEPAAWAFFQSQPPGYRRTVTWWVMSAKREETRARRLATLIEDSAAGRKIKELRRPGE